ncbi:family 20 glycosylhydrolase [Pontibacter qinzhouensis]|uniref:beta-N-acetylhexosaminidase n=1 Tax=Pontibacter qinzhouensis TaxID=2603253 RepID=A0A5C8JH55_9BACT|nr:family 20 glycosylhydrolase [Pontibacter qinzhouensis]TXK36711.1 family 20 glycosylhydrolase [Pontibacter qinzhouensis]
MLIRFLITTLFLLYGSALATAQNVDPGKLQLTWEVKKINYQGKSQTLAVLAITNHDRVALPASGWTLYFNSSKTHAAVSGEVQMEALNGDLNRIVPTSRFTGLPPGKSHQIEYVASGKAMNYKDAPTGFYLVWDVVPSKGLAIPDPVQKPLAAANHDGHITPAIIFERNKSIKDIPAENLPPIFPTPVTYQKGEGSFIVDASTSLQTDPLFKQEANLLAKELESMLGARLRVGAGTKDKAIVLKQVPGLGPEAYQLQVTPERVVISASAPAGAFYGIQSFKSLLPPTAWATNQENYTITAVAVSDAPRFGYRAFMLDVARNFQTKQQVLKVLDLMALYKLNVLHFHLNDDEGWRLEIPGLPELTAVGAKRAHTLSSKQHLQPSHGSGPDTTNAFGSGYYSQADFIEILQYATARHIQVIPEIETPGHARAAIKAMDARYEKYMRAGKKAEAAKYLLRDLQDQSVYRSVQRWNDNVLNVALPSSYAFIEKVVSEIAFMYQQADAPLSNIHMGGDEVPAGVWEKSPAVLALQSQNPQIKSTDDLWTYYFGKVNNILKAKGLYMSGWEEVALQKTKVNGKTRYVTNPALAKENVHAYVWNIVWGWGSEDRAYKLANAGYKTILAPATNFYFDMAYQKDFDEIGTYWATFSDLEASFSFVPFDYYKTARTPEGKAIEKSAFAGKERLTEAGKANIVGLQCLLWTETIRSTGRLEYMLLPKMLGFAERAWAKDPAWATATQPVAADPAYKEAWSQFVNVLGKRELPRLNSYAGGFQYRIPSAGAVVENGQVKVNCQLPGFVIRYTTDGAEPTATSPLYQGPINTKGTVQLKVFNSAGRSGNTTTIVNR